MSDNGGRWSWLAAQMVLVDRHWFTTSSSDEFSRAAATLSLSASCLFTAQTQEKRLITSHTVTAPPHDFDLMFFVTCFLWGVTPRSDVDIDLSRNRKTKFRQQNMNILHDVLHSVTNNQRRGCQRCIPQTNKHTSTYVPWTSQAGSEAAWLWLTGRWASPCCSGGLWVWTQHPQCSLHR